MATESTAFIKTFDGVKKDILISHQEITGNITFNVYNYKVKTAIIKNCTFYDSLIFNSSDLGIGIRFENCIFKEEVVFDNVRTEGYSDELTPDGLYLNLIFENCTFNQNIELCSKNNILERGITFHKCNIKSSLILSEVKIEMEGLNIKDSTIGEILNIDNCIIKSGISIIESTIDAQVRIFGGTFNSLSFFKSTFKKDLYIKNPFVKQDISFNYGLYEDEVKIQCIDGKGGLTIYNGKYNDSFIVEYEDKTQNLIQGFDTLYLDSCEFNNGVVINGVKNPFAERPLLNSITLKVSSKMQGDISFTDLHVGNILLEGINQKATIKFSDIHVNKFIIKEFHNYAKLILVRVKASYVDWFRETELSSGEVVKDKINNDLTIDHSNLGLTQFLGFDFRSFSHISFNNINIADSSFYNVKWFEPSKIGLIDTHQWIKGYKKHKKKINEHDTVPIDYLSRKEIFKQLKYVCDKQGDRIQALEFKKWEMYYYEKYLNIIKHKNLNDRFILYVGKSNDFGQSWIIALGWAIVFTFIFYIPIAIIGSDKINPREFANNSNDILITLAEIFWYQIPNYFQLLNPTHVISKIYENIDSQFSIIYVFDFLHRIVTAFFIFQIISAFRKYLK